MMVSLINNFCLLQKRLKRQKTLLQSTSIPNEGKSRFKDCLSVEYMSSEHSVSEDNLDQEDSSEDENVPRKKKVLIRRPLPWRSQELNTLFLKLDRKANRKVSKKCLDDHREEGWLPLRERGIRWCPWICSVVRKWKLFQSSRKLQCYSWQVILTEMCSSVNITALYQSQPIKQFYKKTKMHMC